MSTNRQEDNAWPDGDASVHGLQLRQLPAALDGPGEAWTQGEQHRSVYQPFRAELHSVVQSVSTA